MGWRQLQQRQALEAQLWPFSSWKTACGFRLLGLARAVGTRKRLHSSHVSHKTLADGSRIPTDEVGIKAIYLVTSLTSKTVPGVELKPGACLEVGLILDAERPRPGAEVNQLQGRRVESSGLGFQGLPRSFAGEVNAVKLSLLC